MNRAISVMAAVGIFVAFVIAFPWLWPSQPMEAPPTQESGFTGDDRNGLQSGGFGIWEGDDGEHDDEDDGDHDGTLDTGFQLFGTAQRTRFLGNDVLRIDTLSVGTFGGASVDLGVPFGTLDRRIAVSVFLVNIDCFGGSPRISLRVDLDGDGASDGNAFAYIGPAPSFTDCAQQAWEYVDMTDGGPRWDTSQLTGATPPTICGSFVCTFSQVRVFLDANFPNHKVLRGSIVQDAFAAVMQGVAFYDDIQLGDEILA